MTAPVHWTSPHGTPLPVPGRGRTLVMAILNLTPDSFSDGGRLSTVEAAVAQAEKLRAEGADILDLGGESTRPGAAPVSAQEEDARVLPVLRALRRAHPDLPLSIDTYKATVAEAAIEAGADIINDVWGLKHGLSPEDLKTWNALASRAETQPLPKPTGGAYRGTGYAKKHESPADDTPPPFDPAAAGAELARLHAALEDPRAGAHAPAARLSPSPLAAVAARLRCPVIAMHNRPAPDYSDFWPDLLRDLRATLALAAAAGIPAHQLWLDPGFGFGKTPAHNLEVLRRLRRLCALGFPVLLGTSRKSTLGKVLGNRPVDGRLAATAATCVWGIAEGAAMLRVHDVAPLLDHIRTADALQSGLSWHE